MTRKRPAAPSGGASPIKRGRPRSDEPRIETRIYNLYMTPEEYDLVRAASLAEGHRAMATWVRSVLVKAARAALR